MKQRIEWIDVAKGLGMILIVFYHIYGSFYGWLNIEIYLKFFTCFFMPLFFIISGFLAHPIKISKKDYIIKITKAYLLPIVIYGIVFYLLTYLLTY